MLSIVLVVHFDGGAVGLVAGSFTGTLVALLVVLWDRRAVLFGSIDREIVRPLLKFGLPFMPSRLAIWALNLSNRILVAWLATGAIAGVFVVGANIAQAVALLVVAFQLAWPPFAYAIGDDGEARLRLSLRADLWLLVSLAVVLPLALDRDWLVTKLAGDSYLGAADAMALTALGLAFFGAYYVVGVAVGRVKKTQLNWIVTGFAAIVNVALLIVLVPDYGATGAGAASAIAYFLMAILMIARGNRVFPWATTGGGSPACASWPACSSRSGSCSSAPPARPASRGASSWPRCSCRSRSAQIGQCVAQRRGRDGRLLARRARRRRELAGGLEHAQSGACEGARGRQRERASARGRSGARTWPPRSRPPARRGSARSARRSEPRSATYQPCAIGPCRRLSERTISAGSERAVPRATERGSLPPGSSTPVAKASS